MVSKYSLELSRIPATEWSKRKRRIIYTLETVIAPAKRDERLKILAYDFYGYIHNDSAPILWVLSHIRIARERERKIFMKYYTRINRRNMLY